MDYFKQFKSTVALRAASELDVILEQIALRERRTKTAVISLALEEYAERHHGDLYSRHKETQHGANEYPVQEKTNHCEGEHKNEVQ